MTTTSGPNDAPPDLTPDIASHRLPSAEYADNFGDVKPPLTRRQALVEADRCHFCYDAPCVEACPTGIDIPSFIRKISTDNVTGSAMDILSANIFGGACARVCPTEILCEQVCVRTHQEDKPVQIGMLQRYATDPTLAAADHPFQRAPETGKQVAVVGAGPAGMSCAHRLAMLGHTVTVFEARDKGAGLNQYGIAAYKVPDDFAQRELDFITAIGGIELRTGHALGRDISLDQLRSDYEAVFLGVGLAAVRELQIAGHDLAGVVPAVDYIAQLRQADDLADLDVARDVVVIGGGNTAIDIAVQSKRLGAETVTLAYRRGPAQMGATGHEQEFAKTNGVTVLHWATPVAFHSAGGALSGVEFAVTQRGDGAPRNVTIPAAMAFTAIGQVLFPDPLRSGSSETLEIVDGKLTVDADFRTSLPGVYAGGDCIPGVDLTVQAVEDGKRAARAIDAHLS